MTETQTQANFPNPINPHSRAGNCEFLTRAYPRLPKHHGWCRLFKATCDTRPAVCTNRASLDDIGVKQTLSCLDTIETIIEPTRFTKALSQRDLPGMRRPN